MSIYIDADACPVKEEVYRVEPVGMGSGSSWCRIRPFGSQDEGLIELALVSGGFDIADN